MLPLGIFGVTVGATLGTRFRVLVLVPVIFFAAATIVVIGFVNGFGVSMFLVALLVMLGIDKVWISGGLLWSGLSSPPN